MGWYIPRTRTRIHNFHYVNIRYYRWGVVRSYSYYNHSYHTNNIFH